MKWSMMGNLVLLMMIRKFIYRSGYVVVLNEFMLFGVKVKFRFMKVDCEVKKVYYILFWFVVLIICLYWVVCRIYGKSLIIFSVV